MPRTTCIRSVSAGLFAACCFLIPSANAGLFPLCTGVPIAVCAGPDDLNTSVLTPFPNGYITNPASFLANAVANSPFTMANGWDFIYAPNPIPESDLKVLTYSAWAVFNTAPTDPDGNTPAPRASGCDCGGANFILQYTPRPNSTDPPTIDFLQLLDVTANAGASQYYIDNGDVSTTPLYIQSGGRGNALERWMYDRPWTCENAAPGAIAIAPNCPYSAATDELTLSETDMFQTLVAVDDGFVKGVHEVTIYGGVTWGYSYSNVDTPTPEPSSGFLTGAFLLALAAVTTRRRHPFPHAMIVTAGKSAP
jgi:hypothetical protein